MGKYLNVILLLAVLLVPGYLFWSWRQKTLTNSARSAPSGPIFATSPAAKIPALQAVSTGYSSGEMDDAGASADGAGGESPEGAQQEADLLASPTAGRPGAPPTAEISTQAAGGTSAQEPSENAKAPVKKLFNPKVERDPFMSVMARAALRAQHEAERVAAERAIEEKKHWAENERLRRVREEKQFLAAIERKIQVQAIVENPQGIIAIINGVKCYPGTSIFQAKILSISPRGVVFSYKGKNFTKRVQ